MTDRILVVNGASYARAVDGLGNPTSRVSKFMESPQDFKLVLFTGGADVDPRFYGDTSPQGFCQTNPERDIFEISIFKKAVKAEVLMTGICRGLQFLNAMSGGKMIHHLENHGFGTHDMITDCGDVIPVNSLHHQMILPGMDSIVTGWTESLSKLHIGQNDEEINWPGVNYEAAIYPNTKCFGVQYHPEMLNNNSEGYRYYYNMVHRALTMDWNDFVEPHLIKVKDGKSSKISQSNSCIA